ncbi:CotH kinase family protein [Archangium primigenium]|uniref:CotH kinase family protein n=1 Tax=[Archangium] primigenium TaxID=2792470 RepID=UPI001959D261|nr:CotH kinase family protein [Archangium primigenium]
MAGLITVLAACSLPKPEGSERSEDVSPWPPSVPKGPAQPPPPPVGAACEVPAPLPSAPTLSWPVAEAWVSAEALTLQVGEASASGSAVPTRARFELWSMEGDAPLGLIWSASREAPASLTQARLAEGSFVGGKGTLSERKRYAARVRYGYAPASCEVWGGWSAWRFFRADDSSGELFDETRVLEFHLDIPPASWAAMNAEAVPPDCVPHTREDHRATLRLGERVFENVGVHVKGGCGSARTLEGKASFKVDLEWDDPSAPGCPKSRELFGRKNLTFDSNVQDPTQMNARLGYAFFRALGMPAPRVASVRMFVNGEYWGLYTHVESIDRRFLARWFEDKDGALYEGAYWCDLLPENVPGPGEDPSGFCLERKLSGEGVCGSGGEEDGYAPLRELTRRLAALPPGGFYPQVGAFLDYERFLTTWAIEGVLAHWDGYSFDTRNNYRVYRDPSTGLWTLLSGGIDQTFGHRSGRGAGLEQDPWDVAGLLAARCMEEADCRMAMATRMEEVTRAFATAGLEARARDIRSQIASDVHADPRKESSNAGFDAAVERTLRFIRERPDRMREFSSPD